MSSPPNNYDRQADFTAYSITHPSDQQPGVDLDRELDNVRASLNKTISRLGEVQRSDGKPANAIVSMDTLAIDVLAALATQGGVPRGPWLTGTAYAVKDIVSQAGSTYVITLAHTSGVFATDLAAGKMMVLASSVSDAVTAATAASISAVMAIYSNRNKVINGNFVINQSGYASGAALAAGSYGHDQWKAGAAGGDYSFGQNASDTTITIAATKSLIQPIENVNIEGGQYTLSWAGTAQARIGISGAAASGAYAASPITVTGAVAGQQVNVEFNAGTVGKVQFESGSSVTPFERVSFGAELTKCQRYFEKTYGISTAPGTATASGELAVVAASSTQQAFIKWAYKENKRVDPTVLIYSTFGAVGNMRDVTATSDVAAANGAGGESGCVIVTTSNATVGHVLACQATADARL